MKIKPAAIGLFAIALLLMGIVAFLMVATKDNLDSMGLSVINDLGAANIIPLIGFGAFALIIIAFAINSKASEEDKKISGLGGERQKLLEQIKEAEGQYLKHKIDQPTYEKITQEKHQTLIKIESEIDASKKQELKLTPKEMKRVDNVSHDKKKILLGLLEQKQKKVNELSIAEKKYLKRQIDDESYKNISGQISKEIIDIEGQISSIQKTDEIESLKAQLKEGAKEIVRQNKNSKERNFEEMEDEIFSQM
ncbi:MAG: hypothetical protein AABW59_02420 [archaeon]